MIDYKPDAQHLVFFSTQNIKTAESNSEIKLI